MKLYIKYRKSMGGRKREREREKEINM